MRSGEEIQKALQAFSKKWENYQGTERAEAQTFLNELFACFGSDRAAVGAKFEDFKTSAGFMDLHWPGVCIVEMKAPSKTVASGRDQVKQYWEESADEDADVPAAQWVILCNFNEFEVWEPGRYPKSPRLTFSLQQLPDRYDALTFLSGPDQVPSFLEHHRELTKAAADKLGSVYQSLVDRAAAPSDEIVRFAMQSVWTMFAEDLGLIDGSPFQKTIGQVRSSPQDSAAKIGFLFRVLNQKTDRHRSGILAGTRYVNGELFADPAEIDLTRAELDALAEAAEYDWSKIEPTIFGSLMERVIAGKLGAHYTHESDIMKIIGPTIVRPWQQRLDTVSTPAEARQILDELCDFRVLDPACGCGNFLYVAYRELRRLEHYTKTLITDLANRTGLPVPPGPLPFVRIANFYGTDIQPAAVLLARVTLWMGHRQMIDRFGDAEPPLPLVNLAGIRVGDAVFDPWPEVDCIVGNPPFLGDRLIRREFGGKYIDQLKKTFPGIGVIDYCGYWFRRAEGHLSTGQRAGLVSTNTLRENKHRLATLKYILTDGSVITDAVSSQKWPGEAKVHVSIVNWIKKPKATVTDFVLDGEPVENINSKLKAFPETPEPIVIPFNRGKAFTGCQPTGEGFIVDEKRVKMLKAQGEGAAVRRYLTADDITDAVGSVPRRWIIDFGTLPLEQANKFPGAMQIVRWKVKPEREDKERHFARLWWQFAWPRPEMRQAIAQLRRFIACPLHGKRLLFSWADKDWCPSNAVGVFAFDDDYSMGVLTSSIFGAWAWNESSTLETRIRLTPSTAFETFPWPPTATDAQKRVVADATNALYRRRGEIAESDRCGLTDLYNIVDDGGYIEISRLHKKLDEAVAGCYGWPKPVAHDDPEILKRLSDLNLRIAANKVEYRPY